MIQVKCGNCKTLSHIDEKHFGARRNEHGFIHSGAFCVSCGAEIPSVISRLIFEIIDEKYFDGWEIGTMFEE